MTFKIPESKEIVVNHQCLPLFFVLGRCRSPSEPRPRKGFVLVRRLWLAIANSVTGAFSNASAEERNIEQVSIIRS
jgi:hypothetical protein